MASSRRDSINLVSYKNAACQTETNGVLVLSEYIGAVDVLPGCFKIKSWDTNELSNSSYDALTISKEECRYRHTEVEKYFNEYTR
jgi:trehalose-6-phosphate synthase